jgi:dTDP-glucose pyrophosphorylase/CBS domain-containing protein
MVTGVNKLISWKKILINPDDSLEYAIQVLHDGGARIVLVVDSNDKLLGTVTDGDIRRALINKLTMTSPIKLVMNKKPINVSQDFSKKDLIKLMTSKGIIHMPILDENGLIVGLETIEHLIQTRIYNNPVFLLAGGFGKRLHPLTEETPKPLLKVGDKPIIETIIQQFIDDGFQNFFISTHYKSEQIKDFFQDGSQYGVDIQYVNEVEPLGTAGSLGLLPKELPDLPILVMNGDLLTKVNFKNLLDFHNNSKSDATMCIREYDVKVPFGVVEINEGEVKKLREKPLHKFFVNAGIYVLNKNLIQKIDGKTYLDMPDFLETQLGEKGKGINAFPIHEYWLDIGRIEEYKKAKQDASLFRK